MKDTLFSRHQSTVETVMIASDRKITPHAIHTNAFIKLSDVMLDDRPPPINDTEMD